MPLLYWPVLHFFAIFFFLHLPNSLSAGSSSDGYESNYEDNKGKYIDKKCVAGGKAVGQDRGLVDLGRAGLDRRERLHAVRVHVLGVGRHEEQREEEHPRVIHCVPAHGHGSGRILYGTSRVLLRWSRSVVLSGASVRYSRTSAWWCAACMGACWAVRAAEPAGRVLCGSGLLRNRKAWGGSGSVTGIGCGAVAWRYVSVAWCASR